MTKQRLLLGAFLFAFSALPLMAQEAPVEAKQDSKSRVDAIMKKWEADQAAFTKAIRALPRNQQRDFARKNRPDPEPVMKELTGIIKAEPKSEAAAMALPFMLSNNRDRKSEAFKWALDTAMTNHFENVDCASSIAKMMSRDVSPTAVSAIKKLAGHKDGKVQVLANFAMCSQLDTMSGIAKRYPGVDDAMKKRYVDFYGQDTIDKAMKLDAKATDKKIAGLYRAIAANPAAKTLTYRGKTTYADRAERQIFEIENLSVGCKAPEIVGKDTDGVEFKLSDYKGKVVFLDFWGHW